MAVHVGTRDTAGRGGRKTVALGCGSLALVLFAFAAGYVGWANRLPAPEVETVVLPNPNGFDACVAAAGKLKATRTGPLANVRQASPAALRAALRGEEPALAELRRAFRLDYRTPPVRNAAATFPYLAQYREAARRFHAQARVAAADGRRADALDHCLDAVELGSRAGQGAVLIHQLVGVACSAIGRKSADDYVRGLTPQQAVAAGRRLDRVRQRFPTYADALREERKFSLALLRGIYSGSVPPGNMLTPGSGSPPLNGIGLLIYPKAWSYRAFDTYLRDLISEAERPYHARAAVPVPNEPLVRTMAPAVAQSGFAFAVNDAELRLLRVELALEGYRGRRGSYPESLARLSELPAAAAEDPFSGRPMVYRRRGGSYALYSVGPNGKDDGGLPLARGGVRPGASGDLVAGALNR